ncbi:MAG: adhesin/invasin [bacterium]|nr:MAG: adhesin/invasin [bacterium]
MAVPDIAFDQASNLVISDSGHNVVRSINNRTGIITTIAGSGKSDFNGDRIKATEANLTSKSILISGSILYIADSSNNRIRQVNLTSGQITTVAGNGNTGFSGDNDLAVNASLNNPNGISLDEKNNLFIADSSNNRIRRVNLSTNIITTVAGSGKNDYSGDGSPAVNAGLVFGEICTNHPKVPQNK